MRNTPSCLADGTAMTGTNVLRDLSDEKAPRIYSRSWFDGLDRYGGGNGNGNGNGNVGNGNGNLNGNGTSELR